MKNNRLQNHIPEGWQEVKLGDLFEFRNGVNSEKASYGSGIRFINIMEIIRHSVITAEKIPGRVLVDQRIIDLNLVKYGDVLFNRTSETPEEIGLTAIYLDNEPVVFGGFVIRARSIGNQLTEGFKKYCLTSQRIRQEIIKRGQGAVRGNIGQRDLEDVPLLFPDPTEQRRVVAVLETWDRAIEKLAKKIEIKKNIKKGLMQQLLTGYTRLAGFASKWQILRLGDICRIKRGDMITKSIISQGNIPVIAGGKHPAYYHNQYNYDGKTITVSGSGASAGFINYFQSPIFASDCSIIKGVENKADTDFIYYQLLNRQEYIYSLQSGGAQPHIYPKDLASLKIYMPHLDEQIKLANIFSTFDKEIAQLEKMLFIVINQKKYLLNNLLSGEIRTPEDLKIYNERD